MRQAEMYPKGSALDSNINAAIYITEISHVNETSLRFETGEDDDYITPIIACFWGQEKALKALSC